MNNTEKKYKILMLDSGRQALPFLRSLRRAGHHVTVACGSRLTTGYFSRYPSRRLLWPSYFHDPESYFDVMMNYIKKERPDVTISVSDFSAKMLSANKPEIVKYTSVTVPDYDVFKMAIDKSRTMAFCMENDIPCPHTYIHDKDSLKNVAHEFKYPIIIKPCTGIGAIGIRRFENADELLKNHEALDKAYGKMLIQEFIPQEGGTQFQAEAFLDSNSKMKVCMVIAKPRFFPVTGGTSTANVTIDRPDIQENVRRLLEGINWVGPADVDLILDPRDNVPKILEINPRVTAGIKIGFVAGIDYADLHVRLAKGMDIPCVNSYKMGVYSRNLTMDILWYLFATKKMRKNTWPSFFNFFGQNVCYQNLAADDPMPLAGFVLGMMKKYINPKVWKAKLGKGIK